MIPAHSKLFITLLIVVVKFEKRRQNKRDPHTRCLGAPTDRSFSSQTMELWLHRVLRPQLFLLCVPMCCVFFPSTSAQYVATSVSHNSGRSTILIGFIRNFTVFSPPATRVWFRSRGRNPQRIAAQTPPLERFSSLSLLEYIFVHLCRFILSAMLLFGLK